MSAKIYPEDGPKKYEEALMNTVDVAPLLKQLITNSKAVVTELKRGIFTNTHYAYILESHQGETYTRESIAQVKDALLDYMDKNHIEYDAPLFSFEYDDIYQSGVLSVIPGHAVISIEKHPLRYTVIIETPARVVCLELEATEHAVAHALNTALLKNMYSHPLDTMAGITEAVAFWNDGTLNTFSGNTLIEKDNRKK